MAIAFRDLVQTLIDRAHEQEGNFHDYKREIYKTAMHSPFKEALLQAPTPTLYHFSVANLPQAAADQHDRELVPSPSHHRPL